MYMSAVDIFGNQDYLQMLHFQFDIFQKSHKVILYFIVLNKLNN